nr:hypothetical protein [Candidatus Sigynarchaeota archaeon]
MSSQQKKKLKVDIYVPMSTCTCEWQGFVDQVFEVLTPYIKEIEFDTKDSASPEAKARKLPSHCIVIGEYVLASASELKDKLPTMLTNGQNDKADEAWEDYWRDFSNYPY